LEKGPTVATSFGAKKIRHCNRAADGRNRKDRPSREHGLAASRRPGMSVFCVRGVDRGRRGDHRSRARAPHNLRVQVPGRAPRPSREGGGCPISLALCLNSYPKGLDERYPRRTSRLGHLAPILFRMLISATTPLLALDAANTPVRLRAVSVAGGSKPPLSPPMDGVPSRRGEAQQLERASGSHASRSFRHHLFLYRCDANFTPRKAELDRRSCSASGQAASRSGQPIRVQGYFIKSGDV